MYQIGQDCGYLKYEFLDSLIVVCYIRLDISVCTSTEHGDRESVARNGDGHAPGRLMNYKTESASTLDILQVDQTIDFFDLGKFCAAV
jgi:hypothetical protein